MAELALAIVPLCIGAIKGADIVRKKLKILRHHDKEMRRLRKKFTAQNDIFLDECQLLLQEILDPKEAESLVENTNHAGWSSPELDEQIKSYLGRKYDKFKATAEEIQGYIKTLNDSLGGTEAGDASKATLKLKATERLKEGIDVMLHKSTFEASISGFRDANQELKRLRKTANKIQRSQSKLSVKRPRPLPPSYQRVTHHSKSFYDALRKFWSCLQAKHTSHDVCLLLDSRNDGSLRVVVRYRTQSGFQTQDDLLDLLVQSQSLRLVHVTMPPLAAAWSSSAPDESLPAKVRRVRFSDDCTNSTTPLSDAGTTTSSTSTTLVEPCASANASELNLCSGRDLCTQLCTQFQSAPCGGYLDSSDNLRHHITPVCDPKERFSSRSFGDPTPLDSIFKYPVERSISISQQVRLALNLVQGVLKFHSTPWLRPYWRLQDLSYFEGADGLAGSLSTLHIGTELSPEQHQQHEQPQCDALMADTPAVDDALDAQLAYGIRNLTMHSLGVALLQIGQWDPLRPDDIVEVRKVADIAERDSRLGPRYQKITQQCLDCDFGFGKDLGQLELQNAVYRDVVCELEALIWALEGKMAGLDR
ncbi:hypothetical protein SLS62_006235 [Diatrype stigma]|uniref:DUF7580 domain-containing protein n=1 Tax=Diatrype stigma TaxID=117547 RepID=A0AAN9USZ7_9PEZI